MEQISRREGYILGPMAYLSSGGRYYRNDLVDVSLPIMRELSDKFQVNSSLSTMLLNKLYVPVSVLHQHDSYRYMKLTVGQLFDSAAGRLFMAYMQEDQLQNLLQGENIDLFQDSLSAFEASIRSIRRSGYAINYTENGALIGIAAPVVEAKKIQAAVGVYWPSKENRGDEFQLIMARHVKKTGILISQRLRQRMTKSTHNLYKYTGFSVYR